MWLLWIFSSTSRPKILYPIENLWEHLKREQVKHNPTSKYNQPMGCR
jgi:hypothetical protein